MKRTEESKLTDWYFEIDRRLLFAVLIMALVGLWAMLSAGSVAAERIGQPWHFFFIKAIWFFPIGLAALFISSFMNKKWTVRLSALNVIACVGLLLLTLVLPSPIKGSARWIEIAGFSFMPADLLKPGFIFMTAWFLTRMEQICDGNSIFTSPRAWRWDGWPIYLSVFVPALLIMLMHPDVGTAALYFAVFGAMLFIAGLPWKWVGAMAGGLAALGGFAFLTMSHFRMRVLGFLGLAGGGDNYQIRKSTESIRHGGLFGQGSDSFVKASLPDAHTDFVYSAIAEDFGAIIACVLLIGFVYILKRLATDAANARDKFVFYAVSGVFAIFALQIFINLGSALGLVPPKGMTLPFISYGGSSFMAFCIMFGLTLGIVREDRWK
ncbi:MAG: FtsW/RodA/SpoVE family cell cycle protein [Rickettsiales bacterium]|jgi:cell division protein FtsW|nr:FtsW/RodA/SpoVE family cell cycle protein [Rickettsiales bacterium]